MKRGSGEPRRLRLLKGRRRDASADPATEQAGGVARKIYELEIELLDIEPRIWRRIVIPASATLAGLHRALQIAMGWYDLHLNQFVAESGQRYSATDPNLYPDGPGQGVVDAHQVALRTVLRKPGTSLMYEYDFGDGWTHRITLVQIRSSDPSEHYPRCLAGERSCPPEDCGGPWGYEELLEALADPHHERHAELREWAGAYFDPEAFDIEGINSVLLRLP